MPFAAEYCQELDELHLPGLVGWVFINVIALRWCRELVFVAESPLVLQYLCLAIAGRGSVLAAVSHHTRSCFALVLILPNKEPCVVKGRLCSTRLNFRRGPVASARYLWRLKCSDAAGAVMRLLFGMAFVCCCLKIHSVIERLLASR